MANKEEETQYWSHGAEEDLDAARYLLQGRRILHGLFFLHLSVEKALKAHVCRRTGATAPRIHNLRDLARQAGLELSVDQEKTLARMNLFNIEGRYPEYYPMAPDAVEAQQFLAKATEIVQWLRRTL